MDEAGNVLRPSFVVGRLQSLCPDAAVLHESAEKEYRLSAKKTALEYAGEHIDGAVWNYFAAQKEYGLILRAMEGAAGYTRGNLSKRVVETLYGKTITLSASRMDRARSCHFAYFMQYGLRAKERRAAGFDAPQVGTFVHDVMENTLRSAKKYGGIKHVEQGLLRSLIQQSITGYIEKNLSDLSDKSARFRYLFQRLCDSVYRIIDTAVEELSESDFEPLAFELTFGEDGQLPAISIYEDRQELRVVGKVDRVDGWLHDGKLYLRVVDYKTGAKRFDLAELRYGLGIQMLLYLFALGQEGEKLFGYPVEPAGLLYFPAREKILKLPRDISKEELEKRWKRELQRSGMVLNDPTVLCAMEHSALEAPCYLPIRVKRNKNGKAEISGSLASSVQLGKLALYAQELLRKLADEMVQGNIDADPWARNEQDNACMYCEFSAACHFEEGTGNDRWEYLSATTEESFWRHVDQTIGEEGGRA